jgi:sporulation protein YlmC with PRC-barrel domain
MLRLSIVAFAISLAASGSVLAQQASNAGEPKTAVAAVRLENGYRASKVIGATVYNDQNQQIGQISDLYMSKQNQAAIAVISVGSFLGVGGKLVSIPFDQLHIGDDGKVVMPNGSKDQLNKMPEVQFNS